MHQSGYTEYTNMMGYLRGNGSAFMEPELGASNNIFQSTKEVKINEVWRIFRCF